MQKNNHHKNRVNHPQNVSSMILLLLLPCNNNNNHQNCPNMASILGKQMLLFFPVMSNIVHQHTNQSRNHPLRILSISIRFYKDDRFNLNSPRNIHIRPFRRKIRLHPCGKIAIYQICSLMIIVLRKVINQKWRQRRIWRANQPWILIPMIISPVEIRMKIKHHFQQQKHLLSNIIWEIRGINQVRTSLGDSLGKWIDTSGVNPRQTVRRDSFSWLTEATNNSNSASMYLWSSPQINPTVSYLARGPRGTSYIPTFGDQRKRELSNRFN